MAPYTCKACGKNDLRDRRALSNHRNKCGAYKNIGSMLSSEKRRLEEDRETRRALKKAKVLEQQEAGSSSQAVDVPMFEGDPLPEARIPTPPPMHVARSGRAIRFPKRFVDFVPGQPTPLAHIPTKTRPIVIPSSRHSSPSDSPSEDAYEPEEEAMPVFETDPDSFGTYRVYSTRPTREPDCNQTLSSVCDAPTLSEDKAQSDEQPEAGDEPPYAPFSTQTAATLTMWQYSGSNLKSKDEMKRLAEMMAENPPVSAELDQFNVQAEQERMDSYVDKRASGMGKDGGWQESTVEIPLPCGKMKSTSEDEVPRLPISGVYHRNIMDIVEDVFADPAAQHFHTTPFQQFWKPNDDAEPVRIHSEVYNSEAMLEAHEEIQRLLVPDDEDLERVVASLMIWSDSTHLASFGDDAVWPAYLLFGNQSKYERGKPTANACHHLAYIPTLPDDFQDHYKAIFGNSATAPVLTHCKRELMHAVWTLLLDKRLMHAYEHGIIVKCGDSIRRRIFPRFFTYSADYPEKVLLTSIKSLGHCPCPRCFVEKDQISEMGSKADMRRRENIRVDDAVRQHSIDTARRLIFENGIPVGSERISNVLKRGSLAPINNAFSMRLRNFAFNFFLMFVVDLLHEFELGVWKAILLHLLRILYAEGGLAIQQLNERYRKVPTFGRSTIRRFHNNVSAMKRLAARDLEDILQCAIPVFEGLLPTVHNKVVLDLLFDLATWHGYAKLRLHTDTTLDYFDTATTVLGQSIRKFARKTCREYITTELPQEEAARGRRHRAVMNKDGSVSGKKRTTQAGPKRKLLNLHTYKLHALGHYPKTIRRNSTTDNYNTQVGELEHKRSKRRYARSSKNKFVPQLAKHEMRERLVRRVMKRMKDHKKGRASASRRRDRRRKVKSDDDDLAYTHPLAHYHMAQSARKHHDITAWLADHSDDPATKNFLPRLKDHLLARFLELNYDGDEHSFSDEQRDSVLISKNRFYEHVVLRVNYTTYDMRRDQDSINPRTHPDIMVLSREDDGDPGAQPHPYWYARVIGVFHVDARVRTSPEHQRMDVLWVRWLAHDASAPSGWQAKRLPRVGFLDGDDPGAFGFLDPNEVVRGVHLIPRFASLRTNEFLGPSIARRPEEQDDDWEHLLVNIFVDRDMFMRYRGGGVGHKGTRACDAVLQSDRHAEPAADDEDGAEINLNEESANTRDQGNMNEGSGINEGDEDLEEGGGSDDEFNGEHASDGDDDDVRRVETSDEEGMREEEGARDEDEESSEGGDEDVLDEQGYAVL